MTISAKQYYESQVDVWDLLIAWTKQKNLLINFEYEIQKLLLLLYPMSTPWFLYLYLLFVTYLNMLTLYSSSDSAKGVKKYSALNLRY